jgi:TetR/AcrR family transcriptional regulator, transcriptional repressor for nem operon
LTGQSKKYTVGGMARTKEFDRDEVLERALSVFWAKGYEATSTDDLLGAMDIGRQSMYDTFGDKRTLFLEALRRYTDRNVAEIAERLAVSNESPLQAIRELLVAISLERPAKRFLGCMGVNAISQFGTSDAGVSKLTRESSQVLDEILTRTVRRAKERGELDESTDERAASQFLQCMLQGLRIRAKAGASPQALNESANLAIEALKPRTTSKRPV